MFLCLFYFYYSPCLRFAVPYRVLLLTLSKIRCTLLGLLLTLRFVIMGCGSEDG